MPDLCADISLGLPLTTPLPPCEPAFLQRQALPLLGMQTPWLLLGISSSVNLHIAAAWAWILSLPLTSCVAWKRTYAVQLSVLTWNMEQ